MSFVYSVAVNTRNTYIWLELYHLWASYVWDMWLVNPCVTLFCFAVAADGNSFLMSSWFFSRCCRIIALQGRFGILQMWGLIYDPDPRQLFLRYPPPPQVLRELNSTYENVWEQFPNVYPSCNPISTTSLARKIENYIPRRVGVSLSLCGAKGQEQNGFCCTCHTCKVIGDKSELSLSVQRLPPESQENPKHRHWNWLYVGQVGYIS